MGKQYNSFEAALRDGFDYWCQDCGRLYKTASGALTHAQRLKHVIRPTIVLAREERPPEDQERPFYGEHPYDAPAPIDAA